MSEEVTTGEEAGSKNKKKVPTWVLVVGGILVFGLILQSCGGNDSAQETAVVEEPAVEESVLEESVAPEAGEDDSALCYVDSGYLEAAMASSGALGEMSESINDGVSAGTEEALRAVTIELRTIYGPRFISQGEQWSNLASCGDSEIDALVSEMSVTLEDLGALLSNHEHGNVSELEQAIVLIQNAGSIATLISARL